MQVPFDECAVGQFKDNLVLTLSKDHTLRLTPDEVKALKLESLVKIWKVGLVLLSF